jgi:phospholipid transport system substrate-binding protein
MNRRLFFLLLATLFALPSSAQTEAPDALVSRVSGEVLQILQGAAAKPGSAEVIALVREKVLPHFDFTRMTALATGVGWRGATPAQQGELVDQFRTLLVRTYSSALSRYQDQTLEFLPPRESSDKNKVIVRSLLKQPGAPSISVDYRMANGPQGWKIYDVVVDGVSLVTTYRDSFGEQVRGNGIDGLIRMLSDKNGELAASAQ